MTRVCVGTIFGLAIQENVKTKVEDQYNILAEQELEVEESPPLVCMSAQRLNYVDP